MVLEEAHNEYDKANPKQVLEESNLEEAYYVVAWCGAESYDIINLLDKLVSAHLLSIYLHLINLVCITISFFERD